MYGCKCHRGYGEVKRQRLRVSSLHLSCRDQEPNSGHQALWRAPYPRSYLNQPLACFLVYLSPWLRGSVLTLSVPLSICRASSLCLPARLLPPMHQLLEGHLTVIHSPTSLLAFPLPCINQASLKGIHTLYKHQSAWTRAHAEDDPQISVPLERQCKNSYLPGPGSQFDM